MSGGVEGLQTLVELVGGPCDGERRMIPVEEALGRIVGSEQRVTYAEGQRPIDRLLDGETVPAEQLEHPGVITHWYSRTDRTTATHDAMSRARVYEYVVRERA